MTDKVIVDFKPVLCFARPQPFNAARIAYLFRTLLKKQDVRHGFGIRRLPERRVRQTDRAEQFCTLRHILSCRGIELIERAFARHHRHYAARLDFVDTLCDKVVVYEEFMPRILAVVHPVPAERHIAHYNIEVVVREVCFLESLYLHVRLRVQFRCDPARDRIQLHAIQLCAVHNFFRHIPEEIACTHRGFQNSVVAFDAQPFKRGVDTADDFPARIVRVQHAPLRGFVFFRREQGFEFRIFLLPLPVRFVKGLRQTAPTDILGERFSLGVCRRSVALVQKFCKPYRRNIVLESRLGSAEIGLV